MAIVDVSAVKSAEYCIERQQTGLRSEVWVDVYAGDMHDEGRLTWDNLVWTDWDMARR